MFKLNQVSRPLWRLGEFQRLAMARLRSKYWALRGAEVGAKCLFGSHVRLDRPWTTSFGRRCVLEPNVWFDVVNDAAEVRVGDGVFFGRGAHLLISDGVTIGDHCLIGDGVIVSDHKHNTAAGRLIGEQGCNSERICIGNDVMICVRAIILQGVTIGDGAIIGPAAIVTQDVAPNAIVGAPPGRVFGSRIGGER